MLDGAVEAKYSSEQVAAAACRAIARVMADHNLPPREIELEDKLNATLGLKSMNLAQIVLDLEDQFQVDPFAAIPITSIRTVGDLVAAYQRTLGLVPTAPQAGGAVPGSDGIDALERGKRRRERRL